MKARKEQYFTHVKTRIIFDVSIDTYCPKKHYPSILSPQLDNR